MLFSLIEDEFHLRPGEQIFYTGAFHTYLLPSSVIDNINLPAHHGIYIGNGYVSELYGQGTNALIRKAPLYDFAHRCVQSNSDLFTQPFLTPEEVRARYVGVDPTPP